MRRASAGIVVLAGLVCMLVGAFLDRRGLGGWDLGADQLLEGDPERVVATVDGSGAVLPVPPGCDREMAVAVTGVAVLRLCRGERQLDLQVDGGAPVPLGLLPGDASAGLDLLRDAFVLPGPGAVVVAVAGSNGTVVGLS